MIFLPDGSAAAPRLALAALAAEARRRDVSYGTLEGRLSAQERAEIVVAWWEAHRETPGETPVRCEGCRHWRPPASGYRDLLPVCNFLVDTGRRRRRGSGGECLEYGQGDRRRRK